jgi:hypothetical protein
MQDAISNAITLERTAGAKKSGEAPLHTPVESGKTVGNIAVTDPIFRCREVDVFYGEKHAIK